MTRLYTEETLIKFYYGECDLFETLEIEHSLENIPTINQEYAKLYTEILALSFPKLSPKQSTIDRILAYSRA
ncbi:MAG: hypothetical protein IPN29_18395 [Saprospiraceae bacterium]|nr:hypothetical protein [Saprospiraceae bacterium]